MTSLPMPTIELVNETLEEQRLREVLANLFVQYPLSKWQYADVIRIEAGVLPHSHPILTLSPRTRSTDYLVDTKKLLGNYIHEQIHWFLLLEDKAESSKRTSAEFRKLYPDLPTERPRGCGDETSNYLHIQVNYLEYLGLSELLSPNEAQKIVASIPYYTEVYALVLARREQIGGVMEKYELIPKMYPPRTKHFIEV